MTDRHKRKRSRALPVSNDSKTVDKQQRVRKLPKGNGSRFKRRVLKGSTARFGKGLKFRWILAALLMVASFATKSEWNPWTYRSVYSWPSHSPLRQWLKRGEFFNWDGIAVFYVNEPNGVWPQMEESVNAKANECRHVGDGDDSDSLPLIETPDVLLIHGFPMSSMEWMKWLEALRLATHGTDNSEPLFARVVAPDLVGFGFSDKPSAVNYSVPFQVEMLTALAQHLSLESVHIVAHDLGDTLVQELLARLFVDETTENEMDSFSCDSCDDSHNGASENGKSQSSSEKKKSKKLKWTATIKSITFMNGGMFADTYRPLFIQKLCLNPFTRPIVAALMSKGSLRRSFKQVWGNRTDVLMNGTFMDETWTQVTHKNGMHALTRILRYMEERVANSERWEKALKLASASGIPMQMINGAMDPISGRHIGRRFADALPKCLLRSIEDAGHWLHLEQSELVLQYVFDFVNENY